MGQRFLDAIMKRDPEQQGRADYVLDTNVVSEIFTLSDIFRTVDTLGSAEAALASPKFRYRQMRVRHSNVLAWWFAKNMVPVGMLGNEVIDIVTGRLAPVLGRHSGHAPPENTVGTDVASYAMTTAIVHVVCSLALKGWFPGSLTTVNHLAKGTQADNEILKVAKAEQLTVITWEGYTEAGVVADPKKLRTSSRDAMASAASLISQLKGETLMRMEVGSVFSAGAWFAVGIVFALARAALVLIIVLASASLVMGEDPFLFGAIGLVALGLALAISKLARGVATPAFKTGRTIGSMVGLVLVLVAAWLLLSPRQLDRSARGSSLRRSP